MTSDEQLKHSRKILQNTHVTRVCIYCCQLEEWDKADKYCNIVLSVYEMEPMSLCVKGQSLSGRGRYEEAITLFQKAFQSETGSRDWILVATATCCWRAYSAGIMLDDTKDKIHVQIPERKLVPDTEIDGVSLTTDDRQPDMITLDCSEQTRAVMPCGHVIGPQSLFEYCLERMLSHGDYEIVCAHPDCNCIWDYHIIRHVACLSSAETADLETRLTLNYLRHTVGYQQCKGCDTWCSRDDPDKTSCPMIRCPVCTERKGRIYDFCWSCLEEWKDGGVDGSCGNAGCVESSRHLLEQLEKCDEQEIVGVMCPAVRACPKCFALLEHVEGNCQHVQCKSCFHWFCFICLHPSAFHVEDGFPLLPGQNACTSPYGCPNVAPRQTFQVPFSLPSLRD